MAKAAVPTPKKQTVLEMPRSSAIKPKSAPQAGGMRKCRHCGSVSSEGKEGPADSEYARQWFCKACWTAWDMQYDVRPDHKPPPVEATRQSTGSAPPKVDLSVMSVKELRRLAQSQGVDLSSCVEKTDMVQRLARFDIKLEQGESVNPARSAAPTEQDHIEFDSRNWEAMSVGDLRRECRSRGMDTTGCVEKADMVNRLRSLEKVEPAVQGGFRMTKVIGENRAPPEPVSMRDLLQSKTGDVIDVAPEVAPEVTSAKSTADCGESLREAAPEVISAEPEADCGESLREAVASHDLKQVQTLITNLGTEISDLVNDFDSNGHCLLHTCGLEAVKVDTCSIVRLLLSQKAQADTPDFSGRLPVELAIETTIKAPDEFTHHGLDTIRALLSSGMGHMSLDSDTCFFASAMLSKAAPTAQRKAVEQLLLEFGIGESTDAEAKCMDQNAAEDGEPIFIDTESDVSDVDPIQDGSNSEGIEEIDMEAAWRTQKRAAAKQKKAEAANNSSQMNGSKTEARPSGDTVESMGKAATLNTDQPKSAAEPEKAKQSEESQRPPSVAAPQVKKPPSLRAAVRACDIEGVRQAWRVLGENAEAALDATDGSGRTLLHVCAATPLKEGAPEVALFLIQHSACASVQDAGGHVPLVLAVEATATAPDCERAGGLATVRSLLAAGMPSRCFATWRSEECRLALQAANAASASDSLVELLRESGADFPWHPLSLRSGIERCEVQIVQDALYKLGDNIEAALNLRDAVDLCPLHICAENVLRDGMSKIMVLLIDNAAEVNICDRLKRSPLSIAVNAGISATGERQAEVYSAIKSLLDAGASPIDVQEWRGKDCPLVGASATLGRSAMIIELLLDFGADFPWHPSSMQECIKACDLSGVQNAMERLDVNVLEVVMSSDGAGDTPLHACAVNVGHADAAGICERLLTCAACPNATNSEGRTPLDVAVEVSVCSSAIAVDAACDTIQLLLDHGGTLSSTSCASNSVLAQAARKSPGKEVVQILTDLGVDLPWYDKLDKIRDICVELGIPGDAIGFSASSNIINECTRWRAMTIKDLRQECHSRKLPIDDCVEKSEIVSRLRQSRIQEEVEAVEHPDSKFVGTWCYGKNASEYRIAKEQDGTLSFDGPHSSAGRLKGTFRATSDDWMEAQLWAKNGVHVGMIRVKYREEDRTMLSNFKSGTMDKWGRDIVSRKQAAVSSASSRIAAADATQAPTSDMPQTKVEEEKNGGFQEDVCADIENDEDLPGAFMAAVDRHDLGTVLRGLERAKREAEEDDDVEALVCSMDLDGNTMLHHCVAGPAGLCSSANDHAVEIIQVLVEARSDVNMHNLLGETPLLATIRAAGAAPLDVVQALLAAEADPSCVDALAGETALMEAASRGELELCKMLIDGGADPAQKNFHGLLARDLSAESGHKSVTRLLRLMCPPEFTDEVVQKSKPLWEAVESGDAQAVQVALESLGDDVEAILEMTSSPSEGGRTLLHVISANAAQDDAGEIVRLLVEQSARLDLQDLSGDLPLSLAVSAGIAENENHYAALDTIRALLCAGAPVDAENWLDRECDLAHSSQTASGQAICKLLSAFGADLPWLRLQTGANNKESEQLPEDSRPSPAHIRNQCAEKRIPVDRIELDKANVIFNEVKRLEGSKISELKREHEKWGLIVEAGVEKQDLVNRIKDILVWQALPLEDLRKDCKAQGINVAGMTHDNLVSKLISSHWATNMAKESQFRNFFDYKKEETRQSRDERMTANSERRKGREETTKTQQQWQQAHEQWKQQQQQHAQDEFQAQWEARAEHNRREFAKGNRNHAGMPTGTRRTPGFRPGQSQRTQQQQPKQPLYKPPSGLAKHFRTLGLPITAKTDEVRKAYRRLALKYHPDKNFGKGKEEAERVFREVQNAYDEVCEHLRKSNQG